MNIKKWILVSLLSLAASVAWSARLTPQFKDVQLVENTQLSLTIMPDAGTQLVFPFALDNPDLRPTLKIRLTNSDGFSVPTDPREIEAMLTGQNTITIQGLPNPSNPGAVYLGNLFITIGGYNLSIALKTTYNPSDHVSNIVFHVDGATRKHMIEQAVARKTERLDREYEEKVANLDQRAKELSLNHIAIMAEVTPRTQRYKREGRIEIGEQSIGVFADRLVRWDNKYFVLYFELENKTSTDFTIEGLRLTGINRDESQRVEGSFNCNPRLDADTKISCTFASQSPRMRGANRLLLEVVTDRGEGNFQW